MATRQLNCIEPQRTTARSTYHRKKRKTKIVLNSRKKWPTKTPTLIYSFPLKRLQNKD